LLNCIFKQYDSPQVLGEAEEKLLKAAQEVNQLRVEESTLRQENLQLRVSHCYT